MCKYDPNLLSIGWPKIGPQAPDRAMVRTLFGLYAGRRGALTQITQYFYNSLICAADDLLELSDVFGSASRDAMFHLKRLGQLIIQYGGDPRLLSYQNGRANWWGAGCVQYQGDPCVMLRHAIQITRQAIHEYRGIEARMEPEPRTLIQRILLDQEHYLDLFQCMLHDMGCDPIAGR